MNYTPETLLPGKFYHVYNRGNNGSNIFFDSANYLHFLKLYDRYISPIADTFAWCLLKNHFHTLVYIKNADEIKVESLHYSTVEFPRVIDPSRQFSHLFNSYTQAINKRYSRSGSLFEKPFRRKRVTAVAHLQKLVFYIHHNPVHHGMVDQAIEYPWSSYESILSDAPIFLDRERIFAAFGNRQAFTDFHKEEQNLSRITKFIIE